MKIVLNSVEDLQELIGVLDAEFLRTWQPGLHTSQDATVLMHGDGLTPEELLALLDEPKTGPVSVPPHPEGATVMSSAGPVDANLAEALGITEQPSTDVDGVEHNVAWHSEPAKINADGRWKARRGRDAEAYAKWIAPLQSASDVGEAEPVATETHALPQDDVQEAGPGVTEPLPASEPETAPTVDHTALIEASQEAAKDAPDGMIALFDAGKEFIKTYGTKKFDALKAAVAPSEDGKGKPTQTLNPGERRLLRACMDNYALYL